MLKTKQDFTAALHCVFNCDPMDMDTTMMCIDGMMQGHGVSFKSILSIMLDAIKEPDYQQVKARYGNFLSMRDFFIYEVNTEAMGQQIEKFRELCDETMDFTLLEKGNKINLSTANGPY